MKPNLVTRVLAAALSAESLTMLSIVSGVIAVTWSSVAAYPGVVLALLALILLGAYGRERYCLTFLPIFLGATIGLVLSGTKLVMIAIARFG